MSIEIEEYFYMSLEEIAQCFEVKSEVILEIIEEGIVARPESSRQDWKFDTDSFKRIRAVIRLQKDLGVNLAGAGLALHLMEEIDNLHHLLQLQQK